MTKIIIAQYVYGKYTAKCPSWQFCLSRRPLHVKHESSDMLRFTRHHTIRTMWQKHLEMHQFSLSMAQGIVKPWPAYICVVNCRWANHRLMCRGVSKVCCRSRLVYSCSTVRICRFIFTKAGKSSRDWPHGLICGIHYEFLSVLSQLDRLIRSLHCMCVSTALWGCMWLFVRGEKCK